MTVTVMMFPCSSLRQERCALKHVMPAGATAACTHIREYVFAVFKKLYEILGLHDVR